MKSVHLNREPEQNCTCQSKFGEWLESAAFCCVPRAVFRSVFSRLSHTRLLRWNKEAFHIDLDTRPPPSPQEPTQRNPLQLSDINFSVPLADGPSSRLMWTLERRLMHIIWVCFYSNRQYRKNNPLAPLRILYLIWNYPARPSNFGVSTVSASE